MVTTRRPGPTLPWRRRPPATWRADGGSGDERVIDEVVLLALGPHELLDADVEPAGHQHRHLLHVAPASVGAGWRRRRALRTLVHGGGVTRAARRVGMELKHPSCVID
jgi:hypothetical protein